MGRRRVPEAEHKLYAYFHHTTKYLAAPFKPAIEIEVPAASTVNIPLDGILPAAIAVNLANTGSPGAPVLYFCMQGNDQTACDPAKAVAVAQGSSAHKTLGAMGGDNVMAYLNVTNTHATLSTTCRVAFDTNWKRLGLSEEQLNRWRNFANAWIEKYKESENSLKKTVVTIEQKRNLEKEFVAFAALPLKTIEASTAQVNDDLIVFNIKKRTGNHYMRTGIDDAPDTHIKPVIGRMARFIHRIKNTEGRPRMHPDAHMVETRWALLDLNAPAPNTPEECPNVELASKTQYLMRFAVGSAGKQLHSFSRWRNNTHPDKSGPWGAPKSIVLSS